MATGARPAPLLTPPTRSIATPYPPDEYHRRPCARVPPILRYSGRTTTQPTCQQVDCTAPSSISPIPSQATPPLAPAPALSVCAASGRSMDPFQTAPVPPLTPCLRYLSLAHPALTLPTPPPEPCPPPMLEVLEPCHLLCAHIIGPIRLAKGAALTTAMASSASNFDGYAQPYLPTAPGRPSMSPSPRPRCDPPVHQHPPTPVQASSDRSVGPSPTAPAPPLPP